MMYIPGRIAIPVTGINFDRGFSIPFFRLADVLNENMMNLIAPGGQANHAMVISAGSDVSDLDMVNIFRLCRIQVCKRLTGIDGIILRKRNLFSIGMQCRTGNSVIRGES